MKINNKLLLLVVLSSILFLFPIIPSKLAAQQYDNIILVADRSNSSVKIFSTDPFKEIAAIKTEEGPNEIAISSDGKKAVVSNYGILDYGSTLTVIDLEKYSLFKTIDLGEYSRPHGVVFLQDKDQVIVTLEGRNSLAIVDIVSGEILKEVKTGQDIPHLIVLDINNQRLFVSNIGSGTVSVIDLIDFRLLKNITAGRGTEGIDISPDGREIWVTNRNENSISIINSNTLEVEKKLESDGFPVRLKFTPDGKHVLVSNIRLGYNSVFNAKGRKLLDFIVADKSDVVFEKKFEFSEDGDGNVDIKVSTERTLNFQIENLRKGAVPLPFDIDVQPDGKYAYISYRNKKFISIVNLKGENQRKIVGIIETGGNPDGIAFSSIKTDNTIIETNNKAEGIESYWDNMRPFTEYSRELNASSDDEFIREYESMFLPVFSKKETEIYLNLKGVSERKSFIVDYIKSKDENPIFPVNYWFLEYSGRITNAKKEFSRNKSPYIDDRGKYYLKYGRPDERFIDRGGIKRQKLLQKLYADPGKLKMMRELYNFSPPAADFHVKPNETWYYDQNGEHIIVHFVKEGYYKEVNSLTDALIDGREKNVAWQWMELIKERFDIAPALYDANSTIMLFEDVIYNGTESSNMRISTQNPHSQITETRNRLDITERRTKRYIKPNINLRYDNFKTIDLEISIAQFKGDNNKTRVEIIFNIPKFDDLFDQDISNRESIEMEYKYVIQNEKYNAVIESEYTNNFDISLLKQTDYDYLISEAFLNIDPMSAKITGQIKDIATEKIGFTQDTIAVTDFSGSELMLSDLKFYMQLENEARKNIFPVSQINNFEVMPYPYTSFKKSTPVFCYFEMYNLLQNRIEVLYDIEIKLYRKNNKNLISKLGSVFSKEKENNFGIIYQRQTTENNSNELISLDLSDLDDGIYLLEINIADQIDKSRVTRITKEVRISK